MTIHPYGLRPVRNQFGGDAVDLKPEDVFKACDALEAQGKATTGYAVRKHIGRGSPTTIQKYTDAWKQKKRVMGKSITTVEAAIEAISQTIIAYGESRDAAEAVLSYSKDMEYSKIIIDLEKRVFEAEASSQKSRDIADSQTSELKELRDRCNTLERQNSYSDGINRTLQQELDKEKRNSRDAISMRHIPRL